METFDTRLYHLIDVDRFNSLVHVHLGKQDYNVAVELELGNDFETSALADKQTHDAQDIHDFQAGHFCYWGTLLSELAHREIIPEGWYLLWQ